MTTEKSRPETRALIHDLCNLEVPKELQISPNAKSVLYSTSLQNEQKKGKHGVSTLWLAKIGSADSSRQITSGQARDYQARWHPRGDRIAFISDRQKPGERWAIYLWNFKDNAPCGEPYPLTDLNNERAISSFDFSPDGQKLAYLCADPETAEHKARDANGEDWKVWGEEWVNARLHTVSLETKRITRHAGKDANSKTFDDHVTALCWHQDSSSLAVVHCSTPHIEEPFLSGSRVSVVSLLAEDRTSGRIAWKADEVLTIPNVAVDIAWASDDSLYFISGTPIDKTCAGAAVYSAMPLPDAQPTKVAFGVEDDAKKLVKITGKIVVLTEHGLHDQLVQLPGQTLLSEAQRVHTFHGAFPESREPILAIVTSDVNTPCEVYSMTAANGEKVRLSGHGAVFGHGSFGSCNFFSCPSLDNEVDLDGIFLTPSATPAAEPQPTVVLIHGGPTARNSNEFDTYLFYWTPLLLRNGYSILLINYRGSTGKGEAFASYSTRGVGKWDYADVVTVTNRAVELNYADQDRLMVGGISQGGFLTYLCSTRNGSLFPWKFRAAVPLNGITDTDTMALTSDLGASIETELDAGRAPWDMMKDDTRNRQASAIWEVKAAVQKARKERTMIIPPMLIMQSEEDERCPIEQGIGMRRALTYHGLPFQFITYPRQPHLLNEQKFWIDMAERLLWWCDTYIGGSAQ